MNLRHLLSIGCSLLLLTWSVRAQTGDLASARALYASASYEEALAMLDTSEAPGNVEQVNQIRALCLLALGRISEAEQAVERIVLQNPGYVIDDADVSPKLVTIFRTVRQRTLPTVARSLYAQAKTSFDEKRWVDANAEFKKMLAIANDPEIGDQRASLTDLRQLGEGFLKLSEAELAAATSKAAVAPATAQTVSEKSPAPTSAQASPASPPPPADPPERPPVAPVPAPPPVVIAPDAQRAQLPTPAAPGPIIYTAQSQDVVPPVELQRPMPRWSPVNRLLAQSTYRGLIEIVIDERGMVESAAMAKPVTPTYDELLLQSTRSWHYTPAKKDGKPVRYRQVLEIVLRPSQREE